MKVATICGVVVAVGLLYVLSVGPGSRFLLDGPLLQSDVGNTNPSEGYVKRQQFKKIYAPLLWVRDRSPMVEDIYVWYFQLWQEEEPG
jgi:hypothetical protein